MIDLVTGSSGFLGKRLLQKIGSGALTIPHDSIFQTAFSNCDRFFFLSTYGNMAGHSEIDKILESNICHLGYVLGAYILESKCEHFTFVSSSSVLLKVQTPYSHAKRAGEEMVLASGLKACVIRPFSVFGRNEQPRHIIPTLIRSCFEGERIEFAPSPVHDWIAVDDVIEGLVTLADHRATGVFELGTGVGRTNNEVLETIERVSGKKAKVTAVNSVREYDSDDWISRHHQARMFGWSPDAKFEDVIKQVIEDYKMRPEKYAV